MRFLTLALALLVALIQFPLWFGKGGWFKVWDVEQQLHGQQHANAKLKARNDALFAEVQDLKTGTNAIEERARAELGMTKRNEVFFQLVAPSGATPAPASNLAALPVK
jgi:cell division protein FtsB